MELEASKRDVKEREKEISSNLERIRRLEADKDRLQEEVNRALMIAAHTAELLHAPCTPCKHLAKFLAIQSHIIIYSSLTDCFNAGGRCAVVDGLNWC